MEIKLNNSIKMEFIFKSEYIFCLSLMHLFERIIIVKIFNPIHIKPNNGFNIIENMI